MTNLIIDTSTRTARVVLEKNSAVIEERIWESDRELGRILLERISEVLEAQNIGWGDVGQIVVVEGGMGGSFMAQRTGMVTAAMLGEAHGRNVVVRKPS